MVTFVELPLFTQQITGLVDDAAYGLFQQNMLRQPDRGDVIPHSGGLRKVRMRLLGLGKSGGARVIYLHLPRYDTIVLFYLYTKAERENLSSEQLRRLRDTAAIIKREFRGMKRNDIEFDPEALVGSVEAFAAYVQGKQKLTLRTRQLPLPAPIKPLQPEDITALRQKLNVSQAVFAGLLNVPKVTAISWEKGRRRPTGAALRLLDLVRKQPEIFQGA